MSEQEYPFKPDLDKKRYSIKITVLHNAIITNIEFFEEPKPTYHEALGVLEAAKGRWVREHADIVSKALEEHPDKEIIKKQHE